MFAKIIVGLDGSETSETALRLACDIAGKYGSELYLSHTPQPTTVAFAMGAVAGYHAVTTMPSPKEVEEAANKILDKGKSVAQECGITVMDSYIGFGHPADEIINYAEECGADLIVTGRRGLGSMGSLMQGSTSQRVNHLAKCATLSTV